MPDQELQIYEVIHRETGVKSYQAATTAEDACKQAGWLIGDCFVVPQKPRRKPVPDHEPLCLVKIPCLVCPYQYAECIKPEDEVCPTQREAPELPEWLKQASQAHLCTFIGVSLAKIDHRLYQKWIPIEDAVKELSAKH